MPIFMKDSSSFARALAAAGHDMTVAALRNPYDLASSHAAYTVSRHGTTWQTSLAALAEVFSGGDMRRCDARKIVRRADDMFVAGIDGGGTSTRLEIRDVDNNFIRRESFGAFNISAIGADAFSARLGEVFAACGDMKECAALCIGAAGSSLPLTERIYAVRLTLQASVVRCVSAAIMRLLCAARWTALVRPHCRYGVNMLWCQQRRCIGALRRLRAYPPTMPAAATPSGVLLCGKLCAVLTGGASLAR